jgi:hypothetical protein
MRTVLSVATFALFVFGGLSLGQAGDSSKDETGKAATRPAAEVTLKGQMVCAKCALHESDKCQNVLKVAEGGKETKYYLADNKTAKDNHESVCSGTPKAATVTGKLQPGKGKMTLTASSIKFE